MNGAATACGSHASTALCFDISPAWVGQGPGFHPLGRVTHIPPSDRLRKQGGHVLLRPRALQTATYFTDRQARADFKAFDKIVKWRGGSKPREGDELPS